MIPAVLLPIPCKSNNRFFSARDKSPWGTQQIPLSPALSSPGSLSKDNPTNALSFSQGRATYTAFPSAPTVQPVCHASPHWYHRHLPPSAPGRFYLHGSLDCTACFTCVMASNSQGPLLNHKPIFFNASLPVMVFILNSSSFFILFSPHVEEGGESDAQPFIWLLLVKVNLPRSFFFLIQQWAYRF